MNLMNSDLVNADDALKYVKIYKGINQERPPELPQTFGLRNVWSFKDQYYTVIMAIDQKQYNSYPSERSVNPIDLHRMVEEGTDALQELVREFRRVIPSTWTAAEKVNFVLAFVQQLPYVPDNVTTGRNEFFRHAIETLVERGGDCEDTSVLSASILNGLGFELVLIWPRGHIAIGVKGNFSGSYYHYKKNAYYYCETTGRGWQVGDLPDDVPKRAKIIPITPKIVPSEPEEVMPVPSQPFSPRPNLSPIALVKGINQFATAQQYEKAIESFKYALNRNELNSEQRVLAHLYWGCSELGRTNRTEPDYDNYVRKAKVQFSKVFRHNPNQKLPTRLDSKRKIRTLFEQVRKESIGGFTITPSLPQTEIWIVGNGINKKIGTGTVSHRLFKGNYIVKGIYKGKSVEGKIMIEPNRFKRYTLNMGTVDNIPPTISLLEPHKETTFTINQRITIRAKVTDNISVKAVRVYFSSSHSRKLSEEGASGIYTIYIKASQAGFLRYYLTATDEEGNESKSEPRKIRVIQKYDEPPTISLLEPPEGVVFTVNQQITIRAKVTDDTSVKEVLAHSPSFDSPKPLKKGSSDIYTIHIKPKEQGFLRYYLTATDEGGNESKSEPRKIRVMQKDDDPPTIRLVEPPEGAKFTVNQQITIRAKVTDDTSIKSVRVHFLPSNSFNSQELSEEDTSDVYTIDITELKAGYIWYYLTATDEHGNESTSEQILMKIVERPGKELPPPLIHQGIWANHAHVLEDGAFVSNWGGDNMLSFAYLREGKTHQTFGAQLDFSYQNLAHTSATIQWGPALQQSPFVFTFLGGIAGYKSSDTNRFEVRETNPTLARSRGTLTLTSNASEESTHITPILGACLKLYPADRVTIDAVGSIKLRSAYSALVAGESIFDTTYFYHYEMGIRVYIARGLNLRAGYGRWYLGDRNITNMQVGLGVTF